VFYLKYDMYRNAWPLLALATYRKLLDAKRASRDGELDGKVAAKVSNRGAGQGAFAATTAERR